MVLYFRPCFSANRLRSSLLCSLVLIGLRLRSQSLHVDSKVDLISPLYLYLDSLYLYTALILPQQMHSFMPSTTGVDLLGLDRFLILDGSFINPLSNFR